MALVVIFTRAGLDLDPVALKKLYCRVLVLALLPWCAEAAVISVTVNYLLDMPWKFAVLCGYFTDEINTFITSDFNTGTE